MDLNKLQTPREILEEKGIEALKSNPEGKTFMRTVAVILVLKGMKASEVAGIFDVTERSVTNWVKKADTGGFDALIAKKQKGAEPVLSPEMIEKINCVIDDDPKQHGFNVWDGPTLSRYIKTEFDVEYSVRSCQYLFHKLGRTLVRPQTYPSLKNPDDAARKAFRELMAELEDDPTKTVVFQDEVHFCAQTTITRKWVRKGSKPRVMSKPGKDSIAYSGFVIPETGVLHVNKPGWFTFETTIGSIKEFLENCPPEDGKRYVIVMDNAPWHKKAVRLIRDDEEYKELNSAVDLIFLPPYSPDLNPIEQVWRVTRREETHNRYFESSSELTACLDRYFEGFSVPNEKLRSQTSFTWIPEGMSA